MESSRLTVHDLAAYLSNFFPNRGREVPFFYHTPRNQKLDPQCTPVERLILSVTPTEGVYTALQRPARFPPMVFLHRPFELNRKRVRRGSTILSSHVGFDEVLTVGWNPALAARLGIIVDHAVCVQGYKGDPDRRIGLVGPVSQTLRELLTLIKAEFGSVESIFGGGDEVSLSRPVKVLAIMNAFHLEEVTRVSTAALQNSWTHDASDASQILYLTGQPRDGGVQAARDIGMKVVCVGHRAAEEGVSRIWPFASNSSSQGPTQK